MIPLKLTLSGFLSYRQPVTLDLSAITVACISGPNGAGKSSLLDAITWALFGQARQRGDAIINTAATPPRAEVILDFAYESNTYRIIRQRERGKTTTLEFQIRTMGGKWQPLTESSLRETQKRIEETLRMDYDTFVHTSFFLQGEADKFSRERPGKRKEVLARILGLQIWEDYRAEAAERRRATENDLQRLDDRMAEMRAEIEREPTLQAELRKTEEEIAQLRASAEAQDHLLREHERAQAALAQQRALVEELGRQVAQNSAQLEEMRHRLETRRTEAQRLEALLARAEAIHAAHRRWEETLAQLKTLNALAERYHDLEARRQPLLRTIASEEARLQEAIIHLQQQATTSEAHRQRLAVLETEIRAAEQAAAEAQAAVAEAEQAAQTLASLSEQLGKLDAERQRLKEEGNDYRQRITQLENLVTSTCPLCGQPLTEEHKAEILAQWKAKVEDLRAQYQEVNRRIKTLREDYAKASAVADSLPQVRAAHQRALDNLTNLRAEERQLRETLQAWEQEGRARLADLQRRLQAGDFAAEARAALRDLDAQLHALGYDPTAHAALRATEEELRTAEADLRALERARAALQPIRKKISDLEKQIQALEDQLTPLKARHAEAQTQLAEAQAAAPDLHALEDELAKTRERIAERQRHAGSLRQQLRVIANARDQLSTLEDQRATMATRISHYKMLEEAFGKNGVPALLIEHALPVLEEEANRILERLTAGRMNVYFRTQRPYKTGRKDMRETLDIIISDEHGQRDYESYSGGEAFRVDFAIRVALARFLAHRAGARLQTLVIDEGFGSQDTEGRQRLVAAIRSVQEEFAKILVITHVEEIKEAFPARIEVRKTPLGSQAEVILG